MKNQTNRTLRKILSIALCLALVMSYVPMVSITASAAATDITVNIDTGASVTLRDADGDDYYDIGTADELYAFAAEVDGGNTAINGELTADIVLNENLADMVNVAEDGTVSADASVRKWTPMGGAGGCEYKGTFDGDGHTITGLYSVEGESTYGGLIEWLDSEGTVKNLKIRDFCLEGNYSGAIAGQNNGKIIGCSISGTGIFDGSPELNVQFGGIVFENMGQVTDCSISANLSLKGAGTFGGIVDSNYGTVTGCSNSGTVTGTYYVGGIVSSNYGTVTGCSNSGTVTGTYYVGGIAGYTDGTVSGCYNTGTVSGDEYVGGIVSSNYGTVTGCSNSGTVTGTYYVGGIAGYTDGTVSGCYNTGIVSGDATGDYSDAYVGGIAGYADGTVSGCYNTGIVSGDATGDFSYAYVGGIAGDCCGTVSGCYNIGSIDSGTYSGGIAAIAYYGIFADCYYLDTCVKTGNPESSSADGITEKTAEQFASGEVAYLLNGDQSTITFKQTLGTDAYPSFTGGTVYQVKNCKEENDYSNTNENIDHQWVNGTCTVCDLVCDHTIENHVCTDCGAMEIVVSFNAGDYEWKTGDTLYFCRISGDNEWEEYVFTATVAGDGTVTWTPDKTLCWDGTGEHKLVVRYPNTSYVWDIWCIDEDQSTPETLRKNDRLDAIWSGNPTTDTITFNLKHRLAKVTVNYEAAEGVTVSKAEVYTLTQYMFFDTNTLERVDVAWEEGYDLWINSYLGGDQFTAFVSPDAYAADGNFIKITLSDGSVREVKMNKAVTFEEGAEYTYKVIITSDGAYLTCADECTFEYIDNGDGTHDKVCGECGYVEVDNEAHTPAENATCTTLAVCDTCGESYGELDPNNHEYEKNNGICCDTYQPAELNESGYYEISNAGQLFWFANYINTVDRTANAVLTADINLENRLWTPIGSTGENSNNFRGVFDGQNHTIKGLYVEGGRAGLGFFGEVRTGTVKNFTIYGEVVANTDVNYVGGVIGSICGLNGDNDLERNGAIIQNITSYVNLTAKTHGIGMIGGFVGYANHESLIENCSWYGTFDAGEYRVDSGAGGFIGKIQENTSEVTIRNCGAYGIIKTNYAKNSYNNTATIYMGGFLSFSNTGAKTTLENCLFAGKFECGENLTDEARLGAFGTLRSVNAIKNCYYLGDDGLEAVHSDSPLKPGENIELTSVTREQLKSGEVAYLLGEAWGQMSNTEGSLPIITDNELYKVVTVGETGNYSVANVGDTNGDGTVDVTDYQALVNTILADNHEQIETASYDDIVKYDLDGDGYLDVIDAHLLHLFINGFTTVDVYAVGDYDLNGKAFEEADIKAIKHAIENPEKLATYKKYASDINGDGKVSYDDLNTLTSMFPLYFVGEA